MMNETGVQRVLPDQSSASGHTFGTLRHQSVRDPIQSKRVCFYKSGDPQFSGLRLVVNNRTFKTFDALLDSLSKKVPLPFGVRNITTPHGVHVIRTLDDLEDGKSYICSDSRKVKPINLALARKKPPPWYHARPVSSRRRTVQQARFFPGRSIHKPAPALVRTPKRLLVFRNGDPTVKHTVVLHRKNTPSYESILEYLSELMQLHVVKLYTPDGKRVDGLPGLILCAGTVVAVGREPFRPAVYSSQKTPPAAKLHNRRQKFLNRKKKSLSNSSKLRNFSPSSERYVVRQIHNSIAGSSFGLPSNPTNSVERDSSRILESVAETEGDGGEGQYCALPDEDDIEKSFRVNQDGSMTVEMKVRLTIKEQETVHWTTTLSRSSVNGCLPEPEPVEELCSAGSNPMDLQNSSIHEENIRDDGDEGPLSLSNGALSEGSQEDDEIKSHSDVTFPRRFPTPGHKQISTKQASVESSKSVTLNGIQEELVGSYSYREQTENGEMTEQYCVVKQSSSRPVPKPRRLGSFDCSGRYLSEFKSAGMSEVLQVESSGEEVTETVLHIYEQQTCQDNYFANTCAHRMSPPKTTFERPATAESGKLSCNNEFEPELCRPSTASESVSIWRAESTSVASDFNSVSLNAGANNVTNMPAKGQVTSSPVEDTKDKRVSTKHKGTSKHVRWSRTPNKRPKKSSAETSESQAKAKNFSSSKFLKGIYGSKSKSGKSTKNPRKRLTKNETGSATTNSLSDDTIKKTDNTPAVSKGYKRGKVSFGSSRRNQSSPEVSRPRGVLTRQTSMHIEKKSENGSRTDLASGPLPALNCTSSSMNEYVENWLEKAQLDQQAENLRCSESGNKQGLNAETREGNGEAPQLSTCQSSEPQAENIVGTSVKLKIQSFENKAAGPPVKKSTVSEDNPPNTAASLNKDTCKRPSQAGTDDMKTLLNGFCTEMSPPVTNGSAEMPPSENKSSSVKILFQKATPSNTLSMELPPPPSADEIAELSNGDCLINDASEVSSPLYKLSSSSSPNADSSLVSPSSEEAASASDNATGMTSSVQAEATLSRAPSIRKAPLVSNLSLERKMSLRKASADKHTLGGDSPSKMDVISTTDKPAGCDVLLNGTSSSEAHEPIKTLPDDIHSFSRASSHSPVSLSSDESLSSTSISSSEASVPSSLPLKEANAQKTSSSPKTSAKTVKLVSPSPERKLLSRKSALEVPRNSPTLPSLQNRPAKDTAPDVGPQKHAASNGSPSAERKLKLYKPKQQKRLSPYSQTLDVVSPPVRHKSGKKSLHRNPSLERKVLTPRKNASLDKGTADLEVTESLGRPTKASQPLKTENQPDMKPVLDKICYSIKSIRQMTQSKRPSCLEKSNSLPDFSSHVASTFGSSSKALLAFLSVMTLKEGISNLNTDELNANNVSCAEALKMIDSLAEIANIEDSHKLRNSLADLQQSASKQLLQSWRGFQELSDRCKSRSSTANSSERELMTTASPEQDCSLEENVIDELMDSFDMPEKLKDELVCLSEETRSQIETEMSQRKSEEVETNNSGGTNQPATDDVGDKPQNDQANVSVRSIIERFTHNNQPKQTGTTCDLSECKPLSQLTKDIDKQRHVAKCPTVEQIPGDMQHYSTSTAREEPKQQNNAVVSKQSALMKGMSSETDLLEECCYLMTEKQGSDCRQLQVESQKHTNLSNDEFTSDDSGSETAVQKEQIEKEVPTQNESCEQSPKDRKRPEEVEVVVGGKNEQSSQDDDLSNPESPSEEDEDKEPSPSCYEEDHARDRNSLSCVDNEEQVESEKEQPEVQYNELNGRLEEEAQNRSMGLNVSLEDSTENSDEEETSSEEEQQPEAESKQLQVIVEETSSGIEEEEEEVGPVYVPPPDRDQTAKIRWLEALLEEAEEDNLSSEEADKTHTREKTRTQGEDLGEFKEKEDPCAENDSIAKTYGFITNDDSGNDQGSCEEHLDEHQSRPEDEQTSCSLDEELSYYGKESSSEEEKANTGHTLCQEGRIGQALSDVSNGEISLEREATTQSVAERVTLLEQQVADSQKRKYSTRRSSQRNAPAESDADDDSSSESPSSQTALCTRSAPQSSLSFSYDSSGVITTEPEGNRVRSIREMFLAKSTAEIQPKRGPSCGASERLDFRAETSVSGGYQSQTSSEPSSGEDDSARKSITKGFVRRTIERLYGKKGGQPDEEADDRPPSVQKQNSKEHSSLFSSLQAARTKAMSELSYFNSTNALDTLTEATRCIAFNAQVGPGDSVPIDNGRWLLGENSLIRKSISDPVGINKSFTNTPERDDICKDAEESTPYSLFTSKSELEDKAKSLSRKCTYFSLPHGSDSDACQEDVPKGCPNGDSAAAAEVKDVSEDTRTWAERNGKLPGGGVTDFRIGDNKVHPLTEAAPDAEVVVKQPAKGQGVLNRRLQEPDMLDFLYDFCGQNCPIL